MFNNIIIITIAYYYNPPLLNEYLNSDEQIKINVIKLLQLFVVDNNFIVSAKILKFLKNSFKEQLKKYSTTNEEESLEKTELEKIYQQEELNRTV